MEVFERVKAIEERIAAGVALAEAARPRTRPCCHCEVGDVPLHATAEEQSHLREAVERYVAACCDCVE